jgi:osmotically-inducible protein OsmY
MTRNVLAAALALAALPLLQGCFPLLAVGGAGAAALMAGDRRTTGIYIEDENIEWKVLSRVREISPNSHINATSFNRKILLTGEVVSEADRKRAEDTVRAISSVREVANELQVAGNSSLASRGSDALITSNVKARMVNNGKFAPNHVKVVTEAGTVYLLGLVTQPEGEAAAEIARTTSGVTRVVKVFEYLGG